MSFDQSGSTVPRRQLGRKLREAREARQINVAQAIAALEWSKPRLWRYETGQVAVRDTKDRNGGVLLVAPTDWAAFIEGVKAGEFDI